MRNSLATATVLALAVSRQGGLCHPRRSEWSTTGVDNLTLTPVVPGGNQPLNIQCVICGDNQPQQQADFGYTNFKNSGNLSSEIFFSTNVAGGGNPGSRHRGHRLQTARSCGLTCSRVAIPR